jgi:cell division protease FtsH
LRQSHKTILIWAILILMFVSIYSMFTDSSSKEKEMDVTEFRGLVSKPDGAKTIEKIDVEPRGHDDARYIVTMKNDPQGTKRVIYGEFPGAIVDEIYKANIVYKVKAKDDSSIWPQVLVWWLPMLLLVGIFFLTFADVAGVDEAKEELEEIIDFLKDPKKFSRSAPASPRACCSWALPAPARRCSPGPSPARPACRSSRISGSDFVEMFVGVGASRVRDLFEQGKKNAPCIIFIDEIDAVGRTAAPASAAATTSASRPSTSCSSRWTASRPTRASSSSPPPTGPTCSTRPAAPRPLRPPVVVPLPEHSEAARHPAGAHAKVQALSPTSTSPWSPAAPPA